MNVSDEMSTVFFILLIHSRTFSSFPGPAKWIHCTLIIYILLQLWTLNGVVLNTPSEETYERFIISASKKNIEKAQNFAKTLETRNTTNIIAALRQSLKIAIWGQNNGLKEKPLIIFLTDGEPNVEMSSPTQIVDVVKRLNEAK